VTDSGHYFQK